MADGPNIDLIVPRYEEIPAFYQAADQMGFHALWFTEMLFSQGWRGLRSRDRVSALSAAAAATSSIRLGTALLGNMDSILSFATETANLDILSQGRLSLGLSQHRWPDEGISDGRWPRIGGRLEETITLLKRLWSGDEVSFKGSHNNLEKASIDVRPAQEGGIPVFVAGVTSAAVNLAATLADGWVHPSGGIPYGAARGCDYIRQGAAKAGRDPDSLELGKIIYLAIDDSRFRAKARARNRIAPLLRSFYGGYDVDNWCAFGPPSECAAFIRGFLDAGITTVMLCLVPADIEHLERLHHEVVPLLK
ncbi:MAG: LLM class flavin-dependent oxidoreductase [Chloroflexi bacterium]|nr:LLM class flavin-dependent oxidoreductase [Chloroflexota bacterium]